MVQTRPNYSANPNLFLPSFPFWTLFNLHALNTTNHISIVAASVALDAKQGEEEEEDMYENEDMNEDGNENENEGEESSLKMQKKVILRKS